MDEATGALRTLLQRLLAGKSADTAVQFFRYLLVGGLAFLVDFGTLWGLTTGLGLHYLVSAALAFLLGLGVNYLLSVVWVFQQRRLASREREFAVFAVIGVVGLGFNELALWLMCGRFGLDYRIAKIVSTAAVFAWNFGARKFLLFRAGG